MIQAHTGVHIVVLSEHRIERRHYAHVLAEAAHGPDNVWYPDSMIDTLDQRIQETPLTRRLAAQRDRATRGQQWIEEKKA